VDFVMVDGKKHKLTFLNSYGDMSRRTLRDDMPGIIQRTLHRARSNVEYLAYLKKNKPEKIEETLLQQTQREDADTRGWRTLPDKTLVARLRLKKGEHQLTLPNAPEQAPVRFRIDQTHQAFSLRAVTNRIFAADVALELNPPSAPQAVTSRAQP
jgi:hypothetical protein